VLHSAATEQQLEDIFTKPLVESLFNKHHNAIMGQ
jgi:hypothetical protein